MHAASLTPHLYNSSCLHRWICALYYAVLLSFTRSCIILCDSFWIHYFLFCKMSTFCHCSTAFFFSCLFISSFRQAVNGFYLFPLYPPPMYKYHNASHSSQYACTSSSLPFSTFNIDTHTIFDSCWCSWILTTGFLHSKIQCHKELGSHLRQYSCPSALPRGIYLTVKWDFTH